MNRSMYSLILMDDVVNEIDRIADAERTSRSNLINQILAEYVSYMTPEKRINNIFTQVENLFKGNRDFSVFIEPHEQVMSMKSALRYKYRPTVKYEVELFRVPETTIGTLKVIFRTQSPELLASLTQFFRYWVQLERLYLKQVFPDTQPEYTLDEGKFTRSFLIPKNKDYTNEDISTAISEYITMFDTLLKDWLAGGITSPQQLEQRYLRCLNDNTSII